MTPDIELVIDELVLHGFERRDRHAIAQAIQDELTTLLGKTESDHAFSASQEITRIDGGTVQLPQGTPAWSVGSHLAQAVHRGIGQ